MICRWWLLQSVSRVRPTAARVDDVHMLQEAVQSTSVSRRSALMCHCSPAGSVSSNDHTQDLSLSFCRRLYVTLAFHRLRPRIMFDSWLSLTACLAVLRQLRSVYDVSFRRLCTCTRLSGRCPCIVMDILQLAKFQPAPTVSTPFSTPELSVNHWSSSLGPHITDALANFHWLYPSVWSLSLAVYRPPTELKLGICLTSCAMSLIWR